MSIDQTIATVPGIPRGHEGPVFREPWEAQAFAMAVVLHERGLFSWGEWTAVLGGEIKRAQAGGDPDTGDTYYRHWLAALERIVGSTSMTATIGRPCCVCDQDSRTKFLQKS
jgi:nitrile hydratase accessory protein